jgi:hypothetical protein
MQADYNCLYKYLTHTASKRIEMFTFCKVTKYKSFLSNGKQNLKYFALGVKEFPGMRTLITHFVLIYKNIGKDCSKVMM